MSVMSHDLFCILVLNHIRFLTIILGLYRSSWSPNPLGVWLGCCEPQPRIKDRVYVEDRAPIPSVLMIDIVGSITSSLRVERGQMTFSSAHLTTHHFRVQPRVRVRVPKDRHTTAEGAGLVSPRISPYPAKRHIDIAHERHRERRCSAPHLRPSAS
jgi:hypothetical protein